MSQGKAQSLLRLNEEQSSVLSSILKCLSHVHMSCITAFKAMTSGDFTVQMLPGSHFYLKDAANEKVILDYITKHLETAEMAYL